MFVTLPRLMLMACLLSPSLSWALGLGEIHLNSALNEPMNAEIDLIAAGPEELGAELLLCRKPTMKAPMGSASKYVR